jgi:hypothetical protein
MAVFFIDTEHGRDRRRPPLEKRAKERAKNGQPGQILGDPEHFVQNQEASVASL